RRIHRHFSAGHDIGWARRQNRTLDGKEDWPELFGSAARRSVRVRARLPDGSSSADEHDCLHTGIEVVVGVAVGTLLPGGRPGGDLGGAVRASGAIFPGFGVFASKWASRRCTMTSELGDR